MAPKAKKQKEVVQDERFQAIVLTDSFETRFMPLTSEKPRCLLPLANVPLIEYTLEFLANADVNEVYLICSSHGEKVQQYIEKSKWAANTSPFKVHTILSLESRSVGDAMRDLDNRGLITGDFLLISGDVVTNIDFNKVKKFHKAKKQEDKEHIVTMVLSQASPIHRTRSQIDPSTFILDRKTDRCIYYQQIPPVDGEKSSINIDPELLEDVEDEMVVRNDLIDCHVDICSPHVPQIFQENFDYQLLRNDFVKGVLTSDLLKKTIYAYISDSSEYAARVESWTTYDAISQDILARWCYPLVPDLNFLEGNSYGYEFNNIYKEDKVILAQSSKVKSSTAIGSNSSVGDGSIITKSVIGRNCKIGKNVRIYNSYVWDDAIIEDNCVLDHSIVAGSAKISADSTLQPGVVVGYRVVVGRGKVIPAFTRIVESPIVKPDEFERESSFESEDEDEGEATGHDNEQKHSKQIPLVNVKDNSLIGEDGVGVIYFSGDENDGESDSEGDIPEPSSGILYQIKSLNISDDSIASVSTARSKKKLRSGVSKRRLSSTSAVSTEYEGGAFSEDEDDFVKEAVATLDRAIENNHDLDTALLELNTLRMSINVSYHEVRKATSYALVARIGHFVATGTLDVKAAFEKVFQKWCLLFKRQVFDDEDKVDLLQLLQSECASLDVAYGGKVFFMIVNFLYNQDIVEEENIYTWWDSKESSASDKLLAVRELTAKLVEWLRDAEEESDDEE